MRILPTLLVATTGGLLASCAQVPSRHFDVVNRYDVSLEKTGSLRMWMAMPDESDRAQSIHHLHVESPYPTRVVQDDHGNHFLYLEATDPEPQFQVAVSFEVDRREVRADLDPAHTRPLDAADRERQARWLAADALIPVGDPYAEQAAEILGGETNPILASRKLYDWVLGHVDYWVKDPAHKKASGVGSANYCMQECTGNCTDFHSLYAALSRSAGIPTKILYGSFFKGPLNGVDQDQSYHCWIEFYAPKIGWIPLDVAVADVYVGDFALNDENRSKVELTLADGYAGKDEALVDYYFGNLDDRRVRWHEGRDLRLDPAAAAQPINALPKAHVELDGAVVAEGKGWTRKLTFTERS